MLTFRPDANGRYKRIDWIVNIWSPVAQAKTRMSLAYWREEALQCGGSPTEVKTSSETSLLVVESRASVANMKTNADMGQPYFTSFRIGNKLLDFSLRRIEVREELSKVYTIIPIWPNSLLPVESNNLISNWCCQRLSQNYFWASSLLGWMPVDG